MRKKVIFLIQQHTNLLDLGGAVHVFSEAQENGLDIELCYAAIDKNIVSGPGLPLGAVKSYRNIKVMEGDYIFIISTDINFILSKNYKIPQEFIDWINKSYAANAYICAICNGAFLLGKTGLLNNRKCTTHWKRTQELKTFFPKADVQENVIFVEDNRVITSAGGTSGVDVSLYIVSKLRDEHFAHKIARELVVYIRRNGSDSQFSIFLESRNHMHSGIHYVQDYVQSNLHKRMNLHKLSQLANMSYRNFCRIFKKETKLTAVQYINLIRKEKVQILIQNKDLSRKQIANLVGLESERQLSRIINNEVNFLY